MTTTTTTTAILVVAAVDTTKEPCRTQRRTCTETCKTPSVRPKTQCPTRCKSSRTKWRNYRRKMKRSSATLAHYFGPHEQKFDARTQRLNPWWKNWIEHPRNRRKRIVNPLRRFCSARRGGHVDADLKLRLNVLTQVRDDF